MSYKLKISVADCKNACENYLIARSKRIDQEREDTITWLLSERKPLFGLFKRKPRFSNREQALEFMQKPSNDLFFPNLWTEPTYRGLAKAGDVERLLSQLDTGAVVDYVMLSYDMSFLTTYAKKGAQ